MVKSCLTCRVHQKMNDGVIPKWYKDIGNDSLLPPILNRNDKYSLKNVSKFKKETPDISDISVSVDIDEEEPEKWLFYWASDPQESYTLINDPKTAYNNEDNHGLVKLDKDGEAEIKLNCPQPYKVDKITYPRHVHYTLEKDGKWDKKIRTYVITCELNYKQFTDILNDKSHIVLNALDEKNFKEYHIPETHNLYYKPLGDLNKTRKTSKIKKFIKTIIDDYPKLETLLNDKKLNILDIPIVTYCEKKECNASEKLLEHLIDSGFTNVLEYPGGNVEFKKNKSSKVDSSKDKNDIYDINIKTETLIFEGIKYKHNILNEEVFDQDNNLLGLWNGENIKWKSDDKKNEHKFRVSEKLKGSFDDDDDDGENYQLYKSDNTSEEDEEEEEEDEEEDLKGQKGKLSKQNDKLSELKRILNLDDKKKKVNKSSKKVSSNISVVDKTYISKKRFDEEFRGWGFGFTFYQ